MVNLGFVWSGFREDDISLLNQNPLQRGWSVIFREGKGCPYLVILLGDFAGDTLTLAAGVQAARAVPAAALHQETARPEDSVGPLELLPDGHGEVARRAAIEPHLFLEQVQAQHCTAHRGAEEEAVML